MTSIWPIIPALFLVLLASYYSQNYAGILASPLTHTHAHTTYRGPCHYHKVTIYATGFAERGLIHTQFQDTCVLKLSVYKTPFSKSDKWWWKVHFSSPFVSYINGRTAHVYIAEGWTVLVCFHSGLFLKLVWCPQVLGWHSNDPIFPKAWQADSLLWFITWLADEFGHGFSCFMWYVKVKMAPMEVIWLFLVKK